MDQGSWWGTVIGWNSQKTIGRFGGGIWRTTRVVLVVKYGDLSRFFLKCGSYMAMAHTKNFSMWSTYHTLPHPRVPSLVQSVFYSTSAGRSQMLGSAYTEPFKIWFVLLALRNSELSKLQRVLSTATYTRRQKLTAKCCNRSLAYCSADRNWSKLR